ncbi:MAG: hypothetical protein ACRD0Z_12885, partial [Acidimicrobiales bacterium]
AELPIGGHSAPQLRPGDLAPWRPGHLAAATRGAELPIGGHSAPQLRPGDLATWRLLPEELSYR